MTRVDAGNLSFHSGGEHIQSRFEPFRAVRQVGIVTDRDTGLSRGFAFVEMPYDGEAGKASSALPGARLDGKPLNVSDARPWDGRSSRTRTRTGGGGSGPTWRRPRA